MRGNQNLNLTLNSNLNELSPILLAIAQAEEKTSGKIHVHLSKRWMEWNPLKRAQRIFIHFHLMNTPQRNAVLIYVNFRRKKFAFVADSGFLKNAEKHSLEKLSAQLQDLLRSTHREKAIALTIGLLGAAYKKYFPLS